MQYPKLRDAEWTVIQPLLPPPPWRGRPRADDRQTVEAVLYVFKTGCRWRDLPREYGAPVTAWRRIRRWTEEGVWKRIWRTLLFRLDRAGEIAWARAFLDGSFVPAKKGDLQSADEAG